MIYHAKTSSLGRARCPAPHHDPGYRGSKDKVNDISQAELLSGSRRREVVEARRVLPWLAVRELGYSGAEVARHLGVTHSCVIRLASAGNPPSEKKYL